MALERKDRIKETTTTTSTGTVDLGGAVTGFRTFVSAVTSGATVRYLIETTDQSEWEVGEGVFTDATPDTLSRVTVYASSNSGSLVNFSAGTKNVSLVLTADDLDDIIAAIPVKAAGSDITTGTDDDKFATAKALADAGVNTRLKSKIITLTRNLTTDGGDVSYTGVGFAPTSLIAIATLNGSHPFSIGMSDSSKTNGAIMQYAANSMFSPAQIVNISTASSVGNYAIVKSYDSDGFTLTWTKEGSPTGTANIAVICFK